MQDFIQQYIDLLIIQYYNKSNAVSEISLESERAYDIKVVADQISEKIDLDLATGDYLTKLGDIVGIKRKEALFNDDEVYRFFIKIKIAQNTASAFLTTNNNDGIQDVIKFAFGDMAFVVDNKDMSIDLYISDSFNIDVLRTIFRLKLLPKPQGVRYNNVKLIGNNPAFGFDNNTLSRPFSSKNDASYVNGGPFARKIIIGL